MHVWGYATVSGTNLHPTAECQRERDDLHVECDRYQAKLTEVWAEVAALRAAAQRLQAYADAHPCDHMPACEGF